MNRLDEIEVFVQIAETGSLSKAAESLNISTATASRSLSALETRLKARLIERSTRRLVLTEVGEGFLRRCQAALDSLKEAEDFAHSAVSKPSGHLRISTSLTFAVTRVAPLLADFTRLYPDITLEVLAANKYLDLIDAGVDVAIHTKERQNDSSLTIRRLGETRRILAAAPNYLAEHGVPRTPNDLRNHKLLIYSLTAKPHELDFTDRDGKRCAVRISGLLEANDAAIVRAAAVGGLGILIQPAYSLYNDILEGRLVPLLEDWELPPLTIHIAYQTREHLPAKVRVFIDYMVRRFAEFVDENTWVSSPAEPRANRPRA